MNRGALSPTVIIKGNGIGDPTWFFCISFRANALIKRRESISSFSIFRLIEWHIKFFSFDYATNLGLPWPGRPGFNPRSCHTKDSKMVLDATLLNTQHYKVRIKDKVEQSRKGVRPPLHLGVVSY